MSLRNQNGGFIRPGYEPLQVPNEPTSVAVTAGDTELSVAFTAPANVGGGAISSYQAATTTGISATASTSPVVITGLSNGTSYNVRVWAINAYGPGPFGTGSGTPAEFQRGIIFAGSGNVIQYITIHTASNATDFGDLLETADTGTNAGGASSTRALYTGFSASSNAINYVTIATTGNASDFGDMNYAYSWIYLACTSNSTRCVWATGYQYVPGSNVDNISYVTTASTGNATDFGDALQASQGTGGCGSSTRGVFSGGFNSDYLNVIQYITIASVGNATDFGDLNATSGFGTSCSSSTRGLHAIGYDGSSAVSTINYFTIASTGNASTFGNLSVGRFRVGSLSSPTRGVFFGGLNSGFAAQNIIDYVTIASTGNATDFGDLLTTGSYLSGTSNCHGGLA